LEFPNGTGNKKKFCKIASQANSVLIWGFKTPQPQMGHPVEGEGREQSSVENELMDF
jgi:hypothetical protein